MIPPEKEIADRETELFASRVRMGLLVWLGAAVAFVVSDLWLEPVISPAIHLARLSNIFAAGAYFYLRAPRSRAQVEGVALMMMLLGVVVLSVTATESRDPSASLILFSVMVLGAATVIPWRFRCQVIVVAAGLVTLAVTIRTSTGSLTGFVSEPMIGVFVAFAASIFIVRVLEVQRETANRALVTVRNDAALSQALAKAGRELIASLDEPALIQRLCALTSEILACDSSLTFLADKDGVFSVVAGFGCEEEHQSALRSWTTNPEKIASLLRPMKQAGVARQRKWLPMANPRGSLPTLSNSDDFLCFPLRKGGEIVGFQAAVYRHDREPHTSREHELRLARGMSDLASLALETARLVDELEEANRFKGDFLANMSHELRTPLNVIIGYAEMLVDGAFGDVNDEQSETIRHLSRAAQGQLELISATLQLSRFESGDVPLESGEFALMPILNDLERDVRLVAKGAGLELRWVVETGHVRIHTDLVKLKMILKNLIDNAVKFTDAGEVAVLIRRVDEGFEFQISDTGPGIPAEAHGIIFEAFRQTNDPQTIGRGGVGMGLYIVKRLVEALGGSIRFDSRIGEGTTFSVWVPGAVDTATESIRQTA